MLTDPIANFLTCLRNATHAGRDATTLPSSRMIKSIADLLLKKGFVGEVRAQERELTIAFIPQRDPLEFKRISKPGQRIYRSFQEIKRVRNGLGMGIYSTSKGILSDEEARTGRIGGEYICEVY